MSEFQPDNLRLTDFMDVQTLQEIQDSFAAVANVKAIITDADGNLLTQPAPSGEFLKRQQTLAAADELLSEARDLPAVLKRTVQLVSEVMGTKAASIRLIDQEKDELVIKAVHNLSKEYLAKGPVRLSKADIDLAALGERGYEFVRNIPS